MREIQFWAYASPLPGGLKEATLGSSYVCVRERVMDNAWKAVGWELDPFEKLTFQRFPHFCGQEMFPMPGTEGPSRPRAHPNPTTRAWHGRPGICGEAGREKGVFIDAIPDKFAFILGRRRQIRKTDVYTESFLPS